MTRSLASITDADISGKTVLVRADLNVPHHHGTVADRTRIIRFAPTIDLLRSKGAKTVIMSHLGRPKPGEPDPTLSLRPVAEALSEEVGTDVRFIPDCVGAVAETGVGALPDRSVALLENLRFHRCEQVNQPNFAVRLSVLADLYVNDAFSCAHRAHASTDAITRYLPAYAGPSLLAELAALRSALDTPQTPVAAFVGGAKVSSKIGVLEYLVPKMDMLIIGGGMANTFLAALGYGVGKSLCEPGAVQTVRDIINRANSDGCRLVLPIDVVVAETLAAGAEHQVVPVADMPENMMALDIGPQTCALLDQLLGECRTVLWNGPLGAFETEPFGAGTFAVARRAAELSIAGRLTSIAGGGDTAAALNAAGVAGKFSYLSTAGGAFLEWLEGRELPGIAALISSRKTLEEA